MRIATVSEHASPLAVLGGVDAGGQNVHVAALALALADRGHRVEVYTPRDDRALAERVPLAPGVDVVHVRAGPARVLPKDDLLPWMSAVAALEAGRRTAVPVVATFHALGSVKRRHQGEDDTSPGERVAVEAALARDVDLVVATCRDEVAELRRMAGDGLSVAVVPCGVDTDHFTPHGPTGPRGAAHRLVSVGRLVERKGVDTAVRALPVLEDTELLVVGGPPARSLHGDPEALRLTALAADLGVGDRVHLVGRVDHGALPAVLRSADVVVATPRYEPFGIVPLEAMACGRPVVGSAVGGLLDSVADEETGALVPPRDPGALAAAVQRLLDDAALRASWGAAARDRVLSRFGWPRVAAATEAAYAAVVARTGRRAAPLGPGPLVVSAAPRRRPRRSPVLDTRQEAM